MDKRGVGTRFFLWFGVVLVVLLTFVMFLYFSLAGPNYDGYYSEKIVKGEIINPASGLSLEEANQEFNESYVEYFLIMVKAYNLHTPPLSSDTPKIEFFIGDTIYNSEIIGGTIVVETGETDGEDIIIRTTTNEAVKILQDKDYLQESFTSDKSKIELIADKSTLFAKGYLKLYTEITGKSITGNIIRIYAD